MQNNVENIAVALQDLLLSERVLLQQGRASEIATMAEEKHALVQKLEACMEAERADNKDNTLNKHIKAVAKIAKENELHFLAVRNGVSQLISRLRDVSGETHAGVYNQHGEGIKFGGSIGRYRKKI